MLKREKIIALLLVLSLGMSFLIGCAGKEDGEELTVTGFAFDTVYTVTLYTGGTEEILNSCTQKCSEYEKIFSRTLEESELYQVNELEKIYSKILAEDEELQEYVRQGYTEEEIESIVLLLNQRKSKNNTLDFQMTKEGRLMITVSDMLRDLLKKGMEYAKASEGSFDLTIEPLVSLWDFTAEKPAVPEKKSIEEALPLVNYQKIALEGNRLSFLAPGMGIDLGGIAKGFIADQLKKYLKEQGVTGALINLGGNVLCLGGKDDREDFNIGIQQPFADRNETVAAVRVRDLSVVSSGIYERYIKTEEGVLYHHIINPKTGYSYDNDLLGVTILSEKSVDGDGLSTTCFSLGREKGMEYINSLQGVYALFITKDEKLWYSDGFEEFLLK